jgi:uncharacterized protein
MWFFRLIIFGIPLLSLLWWIWANRRLADLHVPMVWRVVLGFGVLLLLAGFIWMILERRDMIGISIPSNLYAAVLLWGILFLPMLALPTILGWSVFSIGKYFHELTNYPKPPSAEAKPDTHGMTRREILAAALVGMPVIASFGTTLFSMPQMRRFRIRPMTIFIKNLPEALDGIRIAHVTDTHVGKFTRGKVLDDIAEATNELKADLVLLTGDLIDNSLDDLPSALAMLNQIDPRSGLFMVEGNHDLFDNPREFVKQVRASGIPLLRNQAATVTLRGQRVQIMGVAWTHDEARMEDDVEAVAKLREPGAFPILLAHHPHAFDSAALHGFPLTLAGHTHGGQLMITPKIGAGPAMFRYWTGHYQNGENSLVVSNGAGNWFPLRTSAPAEIIDLTLKKG